MVRDGTGRISMTDGRNEETAAARPEAAAEPAAASESQPQGAETPRPAAPSPAARRGRRVAWLVAAIVVLVAVVASAPFWAPLLPWNPAVAPPQAPPQAATDEAALRATAARLARLESTVQTLAAAPAHPADTATAAALAALGNRVAALEQRPQPPAASPQDMAKLQQDVAALTTRLGQIAAAQTAQANPDRILFAGLAALRAAVAGSGPFDGELAAVTALAHGDAAVAAALQPLAAAAALGIPGTALLAQRFAAETAPAIFRAEAAAPVTETGTGWGQRILARLRALVVVQRIGGGDATAGAVARAQQALDNGDLAAAVAALKSLSGAPQAAAAPWIALAQRRIAAEEALGKLLHQVALRIVAEDH